MKKLISIFCCGALSATLNATIRTVSNVPSAGADFDNIQDACKASDVGDTIYVSGSVTDYAYFETDKKIFIFGPGWRPDKQLSLAAYIAGCTLKAGASASELHGLTFIASVQTDAAVNNVIFIRNRFSGIYVRCNGANYIFEGNWFDQASVVNGANFSFVNNVFYRNNDYTIHNLKGGLFDHNLWYGRYGFYNTSSLDISNNIFVNVDACGTRFSTFNNNITYNTQSDKPWECNDNIEGKGNLSATDPKMVDQLKVNANEINLLLNFTLTASSPGKGKGSDGKDIGLLYEPTGSLNWSRSRGAFLPFISKMVVTTASVPKGGKLTITVEAKKN